jgi:alpha-1,3-rhamnosyltransferase
MEFHTMGRSLNCTGEDFGTYETLIQGNYLPAMSNVVRTAAISEAGGWTVGNLLEDWEMWLKLAKRYRFLYVDENVALYRWHDLNSFKADGGAPVLRSLLLLVEREKDYCREKNILSLWERKRRSVIYHSLRNKQLSFKEKLSLLRSTNKTSLLTSAMKMVVRKIANMS